MDGTITQQIPVVYLRYLLGLSGSGLLFLAGVIMKKAYKTAKAKVAAFERGLASANAKIDLAVNNHLHTIQENTGETVKVLRQMQVDQAELVGYLKGVAEKHGHRK